MDEPNIPPLESLSLTDAELSSLPNEAKLSQNSVKANPKKMQSIVSTTATSNGNISGDHNVNLDDESSGSESDNEEDWEEEVESFSEQLTCLFCTGHKSSAESLLPHIHHDHDWDLKAWVHQHRLSSEDIVRLVSFIRDQKPDVEWLQRRISGQLMADMQADEYMRARLAGDYTLVSALTWDWDEPDSPAEPFPQPVDNENGSGEHNRAHQSTCHTDDARNRDYFDSYAGFNIHCEMLRDTVRTQSYRQALAGLARDKIVLDVGCGSGVLSCFAAKAGARMVIAVDRAEIINEAHEIARDNGVADRIRFVHGDLDRLSLPEQVDLIVSEWMGYFLLFEGMLDSVLAARDRYLKPGGTMIPNTANLFLTAISDDEAWQSSVSFWDDAYGLKFECLKEHNLRFPAVEVVKPSTMVTNSVLLRGWDLMTCSARDTDFETECQLVPSRSCCITALVGYFDVGCLDGEGQQQVMFCTSPTDTPTHWAQSVFYLDRPLDVRAGGVVKVWASVRKATQDQRGLAVQFRIVDESRGVSWQQFYDL